MSNMCRNRTGMEIHMIYCGWDGGGTKTEVCLLDDTGRTKTAVFGPLNPNGATRDRVPETVKDCVNYMKEQAGSLDAVGGLVVGMAGISNQSARSLVEKALADAGWTGPLRLLGDQEIALTGALEGPGLLLIAGTGSVCCGRDAGGNLFRVGGYGYLIDDGGSGWAIGREILAAVVRAEDGRESATVFTDWVFRRLNIASVPELITWLYAPETGKREVAALASLLPDALAQGDEAAEAIAANAANDLAEMAETGWKKSGLEKGDLALTGSILQQIPAIREALETRLARSCPLLRITLPMATPAEGAAKIAQKIFAKQ